MQVICWSNHVASHVVMQDWTFYKYVSALVHLIIFDLRSSKLSVIQADNFWSPLQISLKVKEGVCGRHLSCIIRLLQCINISMRVKYHKSLKITPKTSYNLVLFCGHTWFPFWHRCGNLWDYDINEHVYSTIIYR